jgi:adenosylcobinamide-GDP ribazoletransferase
MRRDELVAAFMLLTRLPVARLGRLHPSPGASVWAYPIVGAVVGAIGAGVFWVAALAGLPPALGALFTVGGIVLVTGGLHEDGLADTADGFGGGRGRSRKLEIMRDSRVGSFGALALIFSLALRAAALVALREPGTVTVALVVAGALGRGAMVGVVLVLQPARASGLGAPLSTTPRRAARVALAIAATFALGAPVALPAAIFATVGMAALAWRQVGGYTGDVLGATEQAAECAVLTALLIR